MSYTISELNRLFIYDPKSGGLLARKSERGRKQGQAIGWKLSGYLHFWLNGKLVPVHRIVWEMHNGFVSKGFYIDHVNHNPFDNRLENLRVVSASDNSRNAKLRSDNKSGHVGVGYHKARKCWRARICVNGKRLIVGTFSTKEAAIAARDAASREYGYHPNHGVPSAFPLVVQ